MATQIFTGAGMTASVYMAGRLRSGLERIDRVTDPADLDDVAADVLEKYPVEPLRIDRAAAKAVPVEVDNGLRVQVTVPYTGHDYLWRCGVEAVRIPTVQFGFTHNEMTFSHEVTGSAASTPDRLKKQLTDILDTIEICLAQQARDLSVLDEQIKRNVPDRVRMRRAKLAEMQAITDKLSGGL